ncbi:ube2j2, partial [Symbiodinium pilosum]
GASASATSVRRLRRELQLIQQSPNSQIAVKPSSASLLEWHFALHSLPADSPYRGGCYHGRLLFPNDYPHAPPTVVMVTPSGRLETGCRLCLSMTDFHPESWNPAWSVDTILTGLLSYFLSDAESGYGSIRTSWETRQSLAEESWAANLADPEFTQLFPELCSPQQRPNSAKQATGQAETQARECWICRDSGPEPLIHPCACRGSMSGVHASCVEQWMRHLRRAGGAGRPRCGVCREPYLGREEQPGIGSFAFHYMQDFAGQLVRSAVLVMMLMGFQDCLQGKEAALPLVFRVLFVLLFGCVTVHKFAVLAASLPLHRPPPRSLRARRFYTSDPQRLARHAAEALTTTCVLAVWYVRGELPLVAFLPFGIIGLGLVLKISAGALSWSCLVGLLRNLLRCALLPLFLLRRIGSLAMEPQIAWSLVHPLQPLPHGLVALVSLFLAVVLPSNIPVVLLWTVHALALAAAVAERVAVGRLVWRHGVAWIYIAQLAFLCTYFVNTLCSFRHGLSSPNGTWVPVLVTSSVWLITVFAMALAVNWEACVRHYRAWQRQHGVFTLERGTEAWCTTTSGSD